MTVTVFFDNLEEHALWKIGTKMQNNLTKKVSSIWLIGNIGWMRTDRVTDLKDELCAF